MVRVATIGIDSADRALTERLMAEGRLPNLSRLRATSREVPFSNDIYGRPEEAWTSFLYGDAPYQSGYWSNLTFDPTTYRSYRQGTFDGVPFYAGEGRRSLVFDVPKSTLASGVEGTQVTGWGAHAASFPRASQPTGLIRELDNRYGPHPTWGNDYHSGWYQADFVEDLADSLVKGAAIRADATRWLLERSTDWDLFLTVLSETHSGGHDFWHGIDPNHLLAAAPTAPAAGRHLVKVYQAVDAALGRIIEGLPENTVLVVFSVHGMSANDSDVATELLLPELLHRFNGGRPRLKGPDHQAWREQGYPAVLPDPRRRPLAFARDTLDASLAERLRRKAASGPLLDVERALRKLRGQPPGHRPSWKSAADVPPETDPADIGPAMLEEPATDYPNLWYQELWPSMRAFSLPSFGEGRIRINLAGRERDGIVAKEDYARTCQDLEQLLAESINPRTGRSIAAEVVRSRRDSPMDPTAPDADLIITWDTTVDAIAHLTLGTIGPFPMLRMGEHNNDGFAYISGPGIDQARLQKRRTEELPALILSLLQGRVPSGRPHHSAHDR